MNKEKEMMDLIDGQMQLLQSIKVFLDAISIKASESEIFVSMADLISLNINLFNKRIVKMKNE